MEYLYHRWLEVLDSGADGAKWLAQGLMEKFPEAEMSNRSILMRSYL
jgi:hypothetical protein